jgi:SAM-dependent methyltransferase
VWRAGLKGLGLLAFGRAPGGPRLYRHLTREVLGTFATHVDKLARVWPGYVEVWRRRAGLRLEGLDLWVHEAGETPFAPLAAYLLTGAGGVVTNGDGGLLDRYLARAVNGVLAASWPDGAAPGARRRSLEPLRWAPTAGAAVAAVGGVALAGVAPERVPLPAASVDLCHSGGALEHYRPDRLDAFLAECRRVLRPGGVASHVFDHRDHLHHADRGWPFLGHLALGDEAYEALCGHPLLYHNRLAPSEVAARFVAAGFEPIAVRRLVLPAARYVDEEGAAAAEGLPGLPRALLARRFREISPADLRTAAAHYLFRKPASG